MKEWKNETEKWSRWFRPADIGWLLLQQQQQQRPRRGRKICKQIDWIESTWNDRSQQRPINVKSGDRGSAESQSGKTRAVLLTTRPD